MVNYKCVISNFTFFFKKKNNTCDFQFFQEKAVYNNNDLQFFL